LLRLHLPLKVGICTNSHSTGRANASRPQS